MIKRGATALGVAILVLASTPGHAAKWEVHQEGSGVYVSNGNPRSGKTTVIQVGSSSDKADVRAANKLANDLNKAANKGPKK